MYFKDKNTTNIDSEFKNNFSLKDIFINFKIPLIVIGCIVLLIIIILLILNLFKKEEINYFITLLGDEYITLYKGDEYIEPGYTGSDNKNNDLTSYVIIDNQVDIHNTGDYEITYTLNDTIKSRYVKIIDKPIGATYIYLRGNTNIYLNIGDEYVEPGYDVIDTVDGNLIDKLKVSNNIDINKAGTYQVIYSVVNSSGVTTSKVRNVIVMDSDVSLTLNNTNYTNKDVSINIYVNDNYFDYLILPNGNKITDKNYTYSVSDNGTYKFTIYNKTGNSKEKSINVSNINKTSPSGSCSGSYENGKSTIKINASDDIGISKYVINGNSYTSNLVTINSEMKIANVTIYDKAGNTKGISCNLERKYLNIKSGIYEQSDYDSEMRYIEVIPDKPTPNMPLVIYLHGIYSYTSFSKEAPNYSITKYVKNGDAYKETKENFIFITPRYILNEGDKNGRINWYNTKQGKEQGIKLKELIDFLVEKYQIDKNRIYITGFSLGGDGTWYMVDAYPSLFASAVVISGCADSVANISDFKTTPILAYHGTGANEKKAGYNTCIPRMVNQINNAGGSAKKIVKQKEHGGMQYIYTEDKDIFKWLLSHTKKIRKWYKCILRIKILRILILNLRIILV